MIERAVRLAQASSSTVSVVTLVVFNLIPLAGVLFWGWNVATLLVLYWVENGIVGILNVPKMLLAQGPVISGDGNVGLRLGGVPMEGRVGLVIFFLIHYGIFWLVHGVFVFALPTFAALGGSGLPTGSAYEFGPNGFPVDVRQVATSPDFRAVAFGAFGLAISHGASFVVNFLGRREYLKVSAARQMFAPYARLVVLHLTILFGAFVSIMIGSPIGILVVLVVLKTGLDLALHLREHGSLTTRPTTPT